MLKQRFPKFQFTEVTTNRKPQVKEEDMTNFTVQNWRSLIQPGLQYINTTKHVFMKINFKGRNHFKKLEQGF